MVPTYGTCVGGRGGVGGANEGLAVSWALTTSCGRWRPGEGASVHGIVAVDIEHHNNMHVALQHTCKHTYKHTCNMHVNTATRM